MASKLPYKIFDWKQKLTRLYLRTNKFLAHKIFAKSRNALLLNYNNGINENQGQKFNDKLKKQLKKTWQIYQLDLAKQQVEHDKLDSKSIEQQYANRQYDAIIVIPNSNKEKFLYNIDEEGFATDLQSYKKQLLTNLLAYRLAHRYLTTTGILILSNSQSDFAEVEGKNKIIQSNMKSIVDAQTSYLGITIGDRDYTDLNSWSVVALSQQFVNDQKAEDYVVKMYSNWANGSNLPMPGSFALFKNQQKDKKGPFVQYL